VRDLPGLDAGIYHFNPADISLRLLRKGDFRGNLAQATGMEPAVVHALATIICTGTYWRNSWKYQAPTYRHFGWGQWHAVGEYAGRCLRLQGCLLRLCSGLWDRLL
jgi:hypothetical protein